MINKNKLLLVAKGAKLSDSLVYILNTKDKGLMIKVKPSVEYNSEAIRSDNSIVKVLQPESILKYDWSTWRSKDVSIDTLIDSINSEYI